MSDYPFHYFFSYPVPPVYKLESIVVNAEIGTTVSVKFSVINDPDSGIIGLHTLKKEGHEKITATYKINENEIVFTNVSPEDGGTYKISCRNEAGESTAVFVLDITVPKGTYPHY